MRIGAVIGTFGMEDPLSGVVAEYERAEHDGLDSAWLTQGTGLDALAALTVAGRATSTIELGVAVVPIQTRHPLSLAQAGRTAALASRGRFTLGVGLSHKPFVEGALGLRFERPVEQLTAYLDVLGPALAGAAPVALPGPTPPLVLAALGPRMLALAARRSAGTVTWLTGRHTLRDHIVPTIRAAANAADRPPPRVLAALPICVTDDIAGAQAKTDERLAYTAGMPSYRAMMAREGIGAPHEIGLIGNEVTVERLLADLADAGVDDFLGIELTFPGEDGARTRALLADWAARP